MILFPIINSIPPPLSFFIIYGGKEIRLLTVRIVGYFFLSGKNTGKNFFAMPTLETGF